MALRFQKYALISAAVVDEAGRLVGMITVDDIVHIIQEEAGEDILRLSGAGDGDINQPILMTVRTRLFWLLVNLPTRHAGGRRGHLFDAEIARYAVLAVLMGIVSGMGGNAGTQTLAVVVRAIATNQLTSSNTRRVIMRELRIAATNGVSLGVLIGLGAFLIWHNPTLAVVFALAIFINNGRGRAGRRVRAGDARPVQCRSGRLLGGVRDHVHGLHGFSCLSSASRRWRGGKLTASTLSPDNAAQSHQGRLWRRQPRRADGLVRHARG